MKYPKLTQKQLLAAETFSFSYAYFAQKVGQDPKFDYFMPADIALLEQAEQAHWSLDVLAEKLETDADTAQFMMAGYQEAKQVILADNAAESFRNGVRFTILAALEEGLHAQQDVDALVEQICFRAADLAYLLELEGSQFSDYSEILRKGEETSEKRDIM